MSNVTELDPLSNYLIVLDFTKEKFIEFEYYYKRDIIETDSFIARQFIYLREDLVGEFKIVIIRDWNHKEKEYMDSVVLKIIDKFKERTNLSLISVKHNDENTEVTLSKLTSSENKINLPLDLTWIEE